jgi:hypothetical protein
MSQVRVLLAAFNLLLRAKARPVVFAKFSTCIFLADGRACTKIFELMAPIQCGSGFMADTGSIQIGPVA